MSTITPYLPQELVDNIIDHIHDDRTSLYSCALVNRSWLHSSRYHLFSSISLKCNFGPNHLCARLYQLLQDNPAIIPYIRHLHILDSGRPPQPRSGPWVANERTLPPLLKLLTHLRRLQICASSSDVLHWKSLPFTLQNAICTILKLPSLTYVRLHAWSFPNLASLATVLSSCQHVKALSLSLMSVCDDLDPTMRHPDLKPQSSSLHPSLVNRSRRESTTTPAYDSHNIDESAENTVNTRARSPRLEVLTLDYVNFGSLGCWLFDPSSSPINLCHIRELRIAHSVDPDIAEQILCSAGPSLEYLHLKPGSWNVYPFDFRYNPNLKSLRLTLEMADTALPWCTTLLSSLSAPRFPAPRSTGNSEQETTPKLSHLSFEFWTDLKKLPTTATLDSTPSTPPRNMSPSLDATTSRSPSPVLSSRNSYMYLSSSSSENFDRSASRQRWHSQPTWNALDSVLSLLPSPLEQVDIGLFAPPSHRDFIRVKEALSGIRARTRPDDVPRSSRNADDASAIEYLQGHPVDGKDRDQEDESGIVRLYQLAIKSKRSFGRLYGPRMKSYEESF